MIDDQEKAVLLVLYVPPFVGDSHLSKNVHYLLIVLLFMGNIMEYISEARSGMLVIEQ